MDWLLSWFLTHTLVADSEEPVHSDITRLVKVIVREVKLAQLSAIAPEG
jgi:hypothetical protein